MKRVEASGHLHGLHLIHRFTSGIEHTAQFQRWTSVGIVVLHHQVLHFLGIDKWSRERVTFSLDILVVLESVSGQHLFHLHVGTWCDLVNHRPGEGNLALIEQVVEEFCWHQSVLHPLLCICQHTGFHLVAVVGAVVHALHGQRQFALFAKWREEALVEQKGHLAHSKHGLESTCQVSVVVGVAFLCDGKRYHLEGRFAENLHQSLPVAELITCLQCFGHRCDDLLLDGAGRLQADQQGKVVIGCVGLVDDLIVEGLCNDDTSVVLASVEGVVKKCGWECTEDVATSEMHPCGVVVGLFAHGGDIKLGKLVAFGLPFAGIEARSQYVVKSHVSRKIRVVDI